MNVEALARQCGLDPDEVEMIAQVFSASVREALTRLERAAQSGDAEQALFALHKIAGSSAALLGLGEINEKAKAGEEALKSGQKPDLAALCSEISEILKTAGIA